MKHRVFVAIGIPQSLQAEILKFEKKFKSLPVRWLAEQNLHLTLAPPWEETDWRHAAERLQGVHSEPFYVRFSRVAFGPDSRQPRLIWVEGEDCPPLSSLRENIYTALNIEPEQRPFEPHLTLARFQPKSFEKFPNRKLNERVNWQFEASSITLLESHLSPEGVKYEALQEIPLIVES